MTVSDPFLLEVQDYVQTFAVDDPELTAVKTELYKDWPGVPSNHYEFLYEVLRRLKPKTVLELGTHSGVSALFMSKACPSTKIYTIDNNMCQIQNSAQYTQGVSNIEFIFGDVLDKRIAEKIPNDLGVIFVDTDRDIDLLNNQLALYYPKLKDGGYMFLDDILSEQHYPQAFKWWRSLEGYKKMDLPRVHIGYEMGAILK